MERNKIWAISNTKTLFGNKFENYLNQKIKINYDSNEKSKLRFKNMVSHSDYKCQARNVTFWSFKNVVF